MPDPVQPVAPAQKHVGLWRKVLAAILDTIMCFAIGGYVIGFLTGNLTDNGFNLNGWPAFALLVLTVLYFVVFTKFLGGTLWQKTLGVR